MDKKAVWPILWRVAAIASLGYAIWWMWNRFECEGKGGGAGFGFGGGGGRGGEGGAPGRGTSPGGAPAQSQQAKPKTDAQRQRQLTQQSRQLFRQQIQQRQTQQKRQRQRAELRARVAQKAQQQQIQGLQQVQRVEPAGGYPRSYEVIYRFPPIGEEPRLVRSAVVRRWRDGGIIEVTGHDAADPMPLPDADPQLQAAWRARAHARFRDRLGAVLKDLIAREGWPPYQRPDGQVVPYTVGSLRGVTAYPEDRPYGAKSSDELGISGIPLQMQRVMSDIFPYRAGQAEPPVMWGHTRGVGTEVRTPSPDPALQSRYVGEAPAWPAYLQRFDFKDRAGLSRHVLEAPPDPRYRGDYDRAKERAQQFFRGILETEGPVHVTFLLPQVPDSASVVGVFEVARAAGYPLDRIHFRPAEWVATWKGQA